MDPGTGLHPTLSREDYDALDRASFSLLKPLKRSPAHCLAAMRGKTSAPLNLGLAVHMAILEPGKFEAAAVWTGIRRGKAWEAFQEAHATEPIFNEEEAATAKSMSRAVQQNENSRRYLHSGEPEASVLWDHQGIACKARLDFRSDEQVVVELKSTQDASPKGFGAQVARLDYLGQCAMYVDGHEAATGELWPIVFIAVEKEFPYAVQVYRVPADLLERGRALYQYLLKKWAWCREQNAWPAYAPGELELELPAWALRDEFEWRENNERAA